MERKIEKIFNDSYYKQMVISLAVKIKYPFEVTINVGDLPIKEKFKLCDAFDAYEVEREREETLVIDVIKIEKDEVKLKITLKRPITYEAIYEYL